jgi:hypothetical protein
MNRWWLRIILMLVLVLLAAPFVAPAWSPINCQHQDIDLDTGRARYTQMLYWIPVSVEFKHTPISEGLEIVDLDSPDGDWHRVNTFSPGVRHSPHYIYHSALSQAHTLGMMWQDQEYSQEARKEAATTVCELWKQTGRDSGANDYIDSLMNLPLKQVTLSDIMHLKQPTENKRMQPTVVPPVANP